MEIMLLLDHYFIIKQTKYQSLNPSNNKTYNSFKHVQRRPVSTTTQSNYSHTSAHVYTYQRGHKQKKEKQNKVIYAKAKTFSNIFAPNLGCVMLSCSNACHSYCSYLACMWQNSFCATKKHIAAKIPIKKMNYILI